MQLYRAVLRPVGAFTSRPSSDTLFGAFCWSYRYYCGEPELEALLEKIAEGKVSVIFSNAFPAGTLPLPLGIRDSDSDFEKIEGKEERRRAYQKHKILKSARFVKKEWFERILNGDYHGFTQGLVPDDAHSVSTIHNMVSRQSGTVERVDGSGNLYEDDRMYLAEGQAYDIYILSELDPDLLKKVLELMCLLGIGKNKSTGQGIFEMMEWHEEPDFAVNGEANAYVALSNFVPAANDPTDGCYKTLVKFGKLDREYAADEYPFKKPILFLEAGAVFKTTDSKPYYGRCITNVSVKNKVIVNGYTIAIPLHLESEK